MAKSTRALLGQTGEIETDVVDAKQITEELVVLSVIVDNVRYDDIFNVPAELVPVILQDRAGKRCVVTLAPDDSDDLDGHPSVTDARIIEE